jgi:aspartyl-tRNA(Asn)/glutamyl-tRNA(Gln) amidotransferase subunit A
MTATDLALASARELVALYRAGEASPVEAVQAALDRIERYDPAVNAFLLVARDEALEAARTSEARYRAGEPLGLLDGVPVAVKDVFNTRGWPTLRGSLLIDAHQPWDEDSPVVEALKRHGAVLMGKTTTPELGWKGVTDSPLTGSTRNPWNPAMTSGGSSGGSAVAVTLGMSALALGTDGGGSIRIPASFCGTAGIKPTYGRIPHWPASPYDTLAHAGPMGWTVADCALMLAVLSEPDPRDWTALPPEAGLPPEVTVDLDPERADVRGLRIALSPSLGFAPIDPEVEAVVREAARGLEALGAVVEEADPGFDDPLEHWETLWYAGAARAAEHYTEQELGRMDPGLARIIAQGHARSAVDYVAATMTRRELGAHMNRFHERYDLLLAPSVSIPPFEVDRDVPRGWPDDRWVTWARHCYPFNMTQQPTVAVPGGFTDSGLPVGLQLVAAKYRDDLAIRAAAAFQHAYPLTDRRPEPGAVE